ncbi:MAG: hypothetical protein MN733_15255 [Nitrososphaera sp.]|nr:hypothetical protein [Nitrososphaera sp.]
MAALPSRVAFLVEANTAIASGTNRIADLPGNIFRLLVFLRDLFCADVGDEETICDLPQVTETDQEEGTQSRSEFLEAFLKLDENSLGREAIEELGLVEEDLLDIVDLVCEPRFYRFRSAFLRTAPRPAQPADVARASARGPVAPSGEVTSPQKKGGPRGS